MSVTKLVIDRSKWGTQSLLRDDDKMCCLGFLGKACGVPDIAMSGETMPNGLSEEYQNKYPEKFRNRSRDFEVASMAAGINDDKKISRKEKEYRLKILFKAHGINLSFKG